MENRLSDFEHRVATSLQDYARGVDEFVQGTIRSVEAEMAASRPPWSTR